LNGRAPERHDAAGRRELAAALRPRLARLGTPLQLLAEFVLGEDDAPIDWVAVEPTGRAWVGLLDCEGGDDTLLARGLAQRAWIEVRLGDWAQLVPNLAARRDLRPRLLLVAPSFSRSLRVAAREADADGIRLARFSWRPGPAGAALTLAEVPLPSPSAVARIEAPPGLPPAASAFRSGLSDRDFEGNGGGRRRG
jgi:hypothetical protein